MTQSKIKVFESPYCLDWYFR